MLIREEREKRNLDQVVVAKRMRVEQAWLSRLESGQRRRICISEFFAAADAIGFDALRALRKLYQLHTG